MNQTLRKAVKEKLIPLNPYMTLDKDVKPKHVRYTPETYNEEDLQLLFTAMQGDPLALMILMDVTYGLRRSEILGLKWSAIDFENKSIHIGYKVTVAVIDGKVKPVMSNVMKTKSSNRTLPLVPMIERELLLRRDEQHWNQKMYGKAYNPDYTDFVFVNDQGDLFKPDYVSKHFRLLLRKNNLKKIRWHDLRHTCATNLCRQKISLKDIQLWLGHSTYQTTADIYTHLDYRDKLNTAEAAANVVMNIMHSGA
jgi:integrase